jgi:hypothetical protein
MSGGGQDRDTRRDDPTAGQGRDQGGEARTGEYGGDDGALEHENAETNTPEDTGSKVEPGRKQGS